MEFARSFHGFTESDLGSQIGCNVIHDTCWDEEAGMHGEALFE